MTSQREQGEGLFAFSSPGQGAKTSHLHTGHTNAEPVVLDTSSLYFPTVINVGFQVLLSTPHTGKEDTWFASTLPVTAQRITALTRQFPDKWDTSQETGTHSGGDRGL